MLPSLAAHDIEKGLGSYIRNEFPIASSGFCDENGKTVIEKFLEAPGSLVKGPWVEVKMPFRSDSSASLPFQHLAANILKLHSRLLVRAVVRHLYRHSPARQPPPAARDTGSD